MFNKIEKYIRDGGNKTVAIESFNFIKHYYELIIIENKIHKDFYNNFIIDVKSILNEMIEEKKININEIFKESFKEYSESNKTNTKEIFKQLFEEYSELNKNNIKEVFKQSFEEYIELKKEKKDNRNENDKLLLVKNNIINLKVLYYSEYDEHFETLSNYFNSNQIQFLNEYYQIQLERYKDYMLNKNSLLSEPTLQNQPKSNNNEVVLYVQICTGSRLDRCFDDKIKLLKQENKNIILTTLLIGQSSHPISIDNFNGPKSFLQSFRNNIYDNEFNKISLYKLCEDILILYKSK